MNQGIWVESLLYVEKIDKWATFHNSVFISADHNKFCILLVASFSGAVDEWSC